MLVDFGTYTCINWIRTLPYLRAWVASYRPHGVAAVTVHTPEFSIEHDVELVRRATREMRLDHPIAIDNEFSVWTAFGNHYWPALYIADPGGRIQHHQFGEGGYEQSERVIRHLLVDAGATALPDEAAAHEGTGIEAPADWDHLSSPETYLGLDRSSGFASPGGGVRDVAHDYTVPTLLHPDEWALAGTWTLTDERAVANEPNGHIAFQFRARDLNLILAPPAGGTVRFRVWLDGTSPDESHGIDVDAMGEGVVDHARLYQLIRQPGPIEDRRFEIELTEPGASAFCFTFG